MRYFLNYLIVIFLFSTSSVNSEDYLSYYWKNDGATKSHYISKIDPYSTKISNIVNLGYAVNENSLVYTNSNSALIAIYLKKNTENDDLIVLDKKSLELIARLKVRKYDSQYQKKLHLFSVFLSSDDNKIIVVSADDSSSNIDIYDIKSGENLYNKSISGQDFNVTRTKDLNYFAIKYTTKKNRIIRVIDIDNLTTSALQNLGRFPTVLHVFNNSVMISSEKPHPRATQYRLSKLDFKTNEIIKYEHNSLTPFVFVNDNDQNEVFVVGRNTNKKKDLFVIRYNQSDNFVKTDYKKKSNPINAVLNAKSTRLMIIGENKLSTINLEKNTLQSRIRIPFDPLDGIINAVGTIGYVQENNGSQVGNFDLLTGKLIEQSSAGRFISQVLVNSRKTILKVLIVGLVPNVIEMLFSLNDSSKNIMLSNDEKQLFVINSTTNDLTIFDAITLKKSSANGTGSKSYLMSQGPNINSPILIIGDKKLSVIDNKDNSMLLSIKNAKLKGLDKENDILFYSLDSTLHVYDMKNKIQLSLIENINSIAVYVY